MMGFKARSRARDKERCFTTGTQCVSYRGFQALTRDPGPRVMLDDSYAV